MPQIKDYLDLLPLEPPSNSGPMGYPIHPFQTEKGDRKCNGTSGRKEDIAHFVLSYLLNAKSKCTRTVVYRETGRVDFSSN